ncbi:MAG: tetratricopeptide repeat protein, partial [Clostridia bacterium]|nr:tetratricopeptide repeat protein [Clostridia bacterium]
DTYLNKEDYDGADRLLRYWLNEAQLIEDRRGELSILNEILGFSRRINDAEGGISAMERCSGLLGEISVDDKTAGTVLLNGATTMKAFGKAAEAIEYYERAERLFRCCLTENDPLWGGLYNNYALALSDLARYDDALDLYQKAIDIMSKKENGVLEIAITLTNVAELMEQIGESDALIEQFLEHALALLNEPELPRNGYYAFVCRKCAPTFGHFGWFMAQKDLDERANRIYEGN